MSHPNQTPDLASILLTLAQHSGQPIPQPSPKEPSQNRPALQHNIPATQASGPPPIDPSRITTYPPALRYTTSLLASNPALTHRIKKLIKSQHEHEKMWWTGRSSVLAERAKRIEGRKAVNDILQGLGGNVVVEKAEITEEEAYREFDGKVWRACREMERDVRRQLKEMGIPGFVVRGELVGDGAGRVSREAIRELEGRMIGLLEDLCRD